MRIHAPRRPAPGIALAAAVVAASGAVSPVAVPAGPPAARRELGGREAAALMARSLVSIRALRLEKGLRTRPRARPERNRHRRRGVHAADHVSRRCGREAYGGQPGVRGGGGDLLRTGGPRAGRRRRHWRQRIVPGARARVAVRRPRARPSARGDLLPRVVDVRREHSRVSPSSTCWRAFAPTACCLTGSRPLRRGASATADAACCSTKTARRWSTRRGAADCRSSRVRRSPTGSGSRLQIYDAEAGGTAVRCFVNVGGATANFGDTEASLEVPNGLVLKMPALPSSPSRGLIFEFAARGVSVVHLLHVKGLARATGCHSIPSTVFRRREIALSARSR